MVLVADGNAAHKHHVVKELFDMELRALRRDRAFRRGPALFLHERTFEDILERLSIVRRNFRSALLIGCPNPNWVARIQMTVDKVSVRDPGPMFAARAGGDSFTEDGDRLPVTEFDLCLAIGTLDTVNNLPLALANIRSALRHDSLLIGAMSGGDTLPKLRAAMRAADASANLAAPHVHPRVDAPSLCGLLGNVGFQNAVVDIDRVTVSYPDLQAEVSDLRAMAATNILTARPKNSLSRSQFCAASQAYSAMETNGRTTETFEILHFTGWTQAA